MDYKQKKKWEKEFYQVLKAAVKERKLKLSAEQDIYKKEGPYFYHASYRVRKVENDRVEIALDITVKYHRFDELQYEIINPGNPVHFTDKIRANSSAKCNAAFPGMTQTFEYDGSREAMPGLARSLLDFLKKYSSDFIEMVEREYGDLDGYYIAHKATEPRLAGLAYLDRKDYAGAIECFSEIGKENLLWSVEIYTEEQRRRAQESGYKIFTYAGRESFTRNQDHQFADYAIALKNGLEWTPDRAMYGLLQEERL